MSPHITKKPTNLEIALFKWVFIPILSLGLLFALISATKGRWRCSDICKEKGFYSSHYVPKSLRAAREENCTCLTEAESKNTKTIPKGVRVI